MQLVPLSQLVTCGTSIAYKDAGETLVLKRYVYYTEHSPRERETCVLQALQRFSWAPRWICTGVDYVLSSFSGRPACQEPLPSDYLAQIGGILSDMRSIRVRHNDLQKEGQTDFMVRSSGVISLVDYGWSTINGSLNLSCFANGSHLLAKATRPKMGVGGMLDKGSSRPETTATLRLPSCTGLYASNRTARVPDRAYRSDRECRVKMGLGAVKAIWKVR